MDVERNAEALIALVRADTAARIATIAAESRGRAQAVLRAAHADARRLMRRAVEDERRLARARIGSAEANLATRHRLAEQHRNATLIAAAAAALPAALVACWKDPAARSRWIECTQVAARAALPHQRWKVRHPPGWPDAERAAFASMAAAATGEAPTFEADEAIPAGLHVAAGGAAVDATLAGLTADRDEIGARLLRVFERLEAEERNP